MRMVHNNIRTSFLLPLFTALLITTTPVESYAVNQNKNNGETHGSIIIQAISYLSSIVDDVITQDQTDLHYKSIMNFYESNTISMIQGVINADFQGGSLEMFGQHLTRNSISHFYNPITKKGYSAGKRLKWASFLESAGMINGLLSQIRGPAISSYDMADWYYARALHRFTQNDMILALEELCYAAHMIQDATVPHHSTDCGDEDRNCLHGVYESYVRENFNAFVGTTFHPDKNFTEVLTLARNNTAGEMLKRASEISSPLLEQITVVGGGGDTDGMERVAKEMIPLAIELSAALLLKFIVDTKLLLEDSDTNKDIREVVVFQINKVHVAGAISGELTRADVAPFVRFISHQIEEKEDGEGGVTTNGGGVGTGDIDLKTGRSGQNGMNGDTGLNNTNATNETVDGELDAVNSGNGTNLFGNNATGSNLDNSSDLFDKSIINLNGTNTTAILNVTNTADLNATANIKNTTVNNNNTDETTIDDTRTIYADDDFLKRISDDNRPEKYDIDTIVSISDSQSFPAETRGWFTDRDIIYPQNFIDGFGWTFVHRLNALDRHNGYITVQLELHDVNANFWCGSKCGKDTNPLVLASRGVTVLDIPFNLSSSLYASSSTGCNMEKYKLNKCKDAVSVDYRVGRSYEIDGVYKDHINVGRWIAVAGICVFVFGSIFACIGFACLGIFVYKRKYKGVAFMQDDEEEQQQQESCCTINEESQGIFFPAIITGEERVSPSPLKPYSGYKEEDDLLVTNTFSMESIHTVNTGDDPDGNEEENGVEVYPIHEGGTAYAC